MVQFNETYDNELLKIKETYKSKFPSILLSKNHPEFKYLVDYINENTPLLNSTEFKYSFTTRVYWVLNHLTDFPKCKNSNCQYTGKIVNWNIPSISKKYKDFCCEDCRYKSKEYKYSIQNAFQEKYGENIKNAYQIQTVKDNLKLRKEEISNKRKQTKFIRYKDDSFNNKVKANLTKKSNKKYILDSNSDFSNGLHIEVDEERLKYEFQLFSKQQKITEIKKQNNNNFIIKYFQQDTFFKTEKQLYLNKEIREKLENNREKYLFKDKSKLSSLELLDGFKKSGIYYGYSHFNPYWFKFFIDRFNLKSVYDPCGGWGHRLLGGLCLQKYIYNDLSKSTKENVDKIIQYFNIKNTETYNFDARTFIPEENFEAMFTCPPYFNVEHYECGDFESRESFDQFIDKLFEVFYKKQSCKYFGLVIREDLFGNHNNYFEKFLLSRQTSKYLNKKQNENNEYLYVFCK